MKGEGKIIRVAGPLVIARGIPEAKMYDVVKVGKKNLIGEIIELKGDTASIQVYEETAGIGPGEPVLSTGEPLSVELGPGLLSSIFDGIQRPLDVMRDKVGDFITRGLSLPSLDREKKWVFIPRVKMGEEVNEGDILGEVQETKYLKHFVLVPLGISGRVEEIKEGEFTVEETVAVLKERNGKERKLSLMQRWPVRTPRPYKQRLAPYSLLVTGQRVVDTFFPLAKGGTACVPGPFGSGKTVIQHQLAKWSNADIIIYIGCGERGNEMASVLLEFPELEDPYTNEPLINRTVLIANTSNMPVSAREASIYTGITIAEYFRDMGYHVAVMADSTSRWAEALREISGRLEEMPGEEGYPAYLPQRVAGFYERAGRVVCLGREEREGSVSIIGAVSPPGGDLSDPVVQATLKIVKVFWSLEDWLAYRRHFPAINWLSSYSLYVDNLEEFLKKELSPDWLNMRRESLKILEEEANLQEIVRLVGIESLSPRERLLLETARSLREDFLHQNAFDPVDTYSTLKKQVYMLKIILEFHHRAQKFIENGGSLEEVLSSPLKEEIARMRYIKNEDEESMKILLEKVSKVFEVVNA
ncbi:V-type ATP synthase subunit A [Candidatus Calescamantes bacterium]|nr:V-type ATP synthase subunit A [Candidatus Calescamantes bacterium]